MQEQVIKQQVRQEAVAHGQAGQDQQTLRGSEKLKLAWENRALTEDAVAELAEALDASPADVTSVRVLGGRDAVGVEVSKRYGFDDGDICGNDMSFWLAWLRRHGGGGYVPPKVIINGIPHPIELFVTYTFGRPEAQVHQVGDLGLPGLGSIEIRG
jgi:hypothetical protein